MTIDHRPPPPGVRRLFWRYRMRFEATFGLSMLETWEKALVWSTLLFITFLFWLSVFTYFPTHLAFLRRRFSYYIFGDENVDLLVVLATYVKEWLGRTWDDPASLVGLGKSLTTSTSAVGGDVLGSGSVGGSTGGNAIKVDL